MGQNIYSGTFHSSAIGPWSNGFTDGLAVDQHQACAQFFGPLGQGGNAPGGHMGQLDADDKSQGEVALLLASETQQAGDQFLHIGSIGVIGDGDGSVAPDDYAAQELAGQQHPITEERMDVEVNAFGVCQGWLL